MNSGARIPPHNDDAERSVLGAVLIKVSALHEVTAVLSPDDFFDGRLREIYESMLAVARKGSPLDVLTLAAEMRLRGTLKTLNGAETMLVDLAQAVSQAENVGHYIKIVREMADMRRLLHLLSEVTARAYGDHGDVSAFFAEFEQEVYKLSHRRPSGSVVDLSVYMRQYYELLSDRAELYRAGRARGVTTGLTRFDALLGGMQPEGLYVIAGRPGRGKSALAVNNILAHVALELGHPVFVASLEMSREEIADRLLAGLTRINGTLIHAGALSSEHFQKIHPEVTRLMATKVRIDDQGAQTIAHVSSQARRFRADPSFFPPSADEKHAHLGLVIVDYLQLVEGTERSARHGRVQEVGEVARGLKALAKATKLPVLALCQLSRKIEERADGRPLLSDLRESGDIEQNADAVIFIHEDDGKWELIVGKHRHGDLGSRRVTFIPELTRFENYAPEPDEPLY